MFHSATDVSTPGTPIPGSGVIVCQPADVLVSEAGARYAIKITDYLVELFGYEVP